MLIVYCQLIDQCLKLTTKTELEPKPENEKLDTLAISTVTKSVDHLEVENPGTD